MWVQGVSTRKVKEITEALCGLDVTSAQVSRVSRLLDKELEAWRNRPLGACPYVLLDARYEKVRHGGRIVRTALLYAVGIDRQGKRSVLGVSVSLSEAEVHWRAFLQGLLERGLHGVELITSDGHEGLKAALEAVFSGAAWQRCRFHLQQNVQVDVPRIEQRPPVGRDIQAVFQAPGRSEAERILEGMAEKWRSEAPRLADWMLENLLEGFTVFDFPSSHRRRLRTTNLLERLSREIKRRTRVASRFPNEASLLRLASAFLAEISDDWETGRDYLRMEAG